MDDGRLMDGGRTADVGGGRACCISFFLFDVNCANIADIHVYAHTYIYICIYMTGSDLLLGQVDFKKGIWPPPRPKLRVQQGHKGRAQQVTMAGAQQLPKGRAQGKGPKEGPN